MMKKINERTLRNWRRKALLLIDEGPIEGTMDAAIRYNSKQELAEYILSLTQELLDEHMLRKEGKDNG